MADQRFAEMNDSDKICHLWRVIGAIRAEADPEGLIATSLGKTPRQRLAGIWETLQELERAMQTE